MDWFFVVVIGLVIGSFLNVCIYRIPRGESIVSPPSHCTGCGTRLRPPDLVPVASFLLLRGRCRHCGCKISWRYPLTELVTALLFLASYLLLGMDKQLLLALVLESILIVVFQIDIEHYQIPNRVLLVGTVMIIMANFFFNFLIWPQMLLGFLAGGLPLFLLAVVRPDGMGMGDVKLAAMLGLFLGWQKVLLVIFLAALLGALSGLALIWLGCRTRKEPFPFGPFLAAAALIAFFWGGFIIRWYVLTFIP